MKRAFTLIELLVYMAIMGFIIVVAGRVFSDSTSMRVRSQNLLKSSSEIGKLANLLSEDISQMGVKAWGVETIDEGYKIIFHNAVYMDANNSDIKKRDSSSYILRGKRGPNDTVFSDTLIFRKAVFDAAGKFIAVREISWYRDGKDLFRKCRQITNQYPDGANGMSNGESDGDCTTEDVLVATNITNFKLTPAMQIEEPPLFSGNFGLYAKEEGYAKKPTCGNYGCQTVLSGFESNSDPQGKIHHELYLNGFNEHEPIPQSCDDTQLFKNCKQMTFYGGKTYAIEFKMLYNNDYSTQFQPGKDHLSIGFRTNNGGTIDKAPKDVLFYPPQDISGNTITRHIEFSVNDTIKNACVAIKLAFYSPTAKDGKLTFDDFKVLHKADESFSFEGVEPLYGIIQDDSDNDSLKISQKRKVKAFELLVEMAIGKEDRKAGTFSQKGRGIIIATPNNGVIASDGEE